MENGTVRIKLDELLKESGLSKKKLSHRAEMQRTQNNNYCRKEVYAITWEFFYKVI